MDWKALTTEAQLEQIKADSFQRPQLIFKHSTRCSISAVARQRLQKGALPSEIDFYYLDLLGYRSLSNQIADTFGVQHESPQVLLIKNGACMYDESHLGISMREILEQAMAV